MGPGGATCACNLARAGLKVLALEKRIMPRAKLCAGGLSPKAIAMLDFDIASAVECQVRGGTVYTKSGHDLEMSSQNEIGLIVDRARFDHLLLKRAASAGALIHEGEPVVKIIPGEIIQVQTDRGTYQTRYLVGADGANSVVARDLNYARRHCGYTLECVIPDTFEVIRKHAASPTFFYEYLPSGYGWIFPKRGGASVGIGVLTKHTRAIRHHFQQFLTDIGLPADYATRCKGFPLPAYTLRTRNRHGRDNILLVGDAACLVDPITGEGIYHAMKSGELAAQAIIGAMPLNRSASIPYGQSLKKIKQDLLVAYLLAFPLNKFPSLSILTLRENREIVHILKDITLGQGRYRDLITVGLMAIPKTIIAYLKGHR